MPKLIFRHTGRTRHRFVTASLLFSVPVRRRIIAVCVIAEFACLITLAVEVRVFHHGGSLIATAVLLLGVVCGLNYLRSTHRPRPAYRLYRDETACDSDDWGPPHGVYPSLFDAMRAAKGIPLSCWKTNPDCPDETFTETCPQWTILGPGAAAEAEAMHVPPPWTERS